MAMQKQKIPLELTTGIDTKSDEFNSVSFKNVENFRFNKPGALNKVPGYTAYNTNLLNVSSTVPAITAGTSIYSYKKELLLNTPQQLLAYSDVYGEWISKNYFNVNGSAFTSKKANTSITFVNTTEQTLFDDFSGTVHADKFADSSYTMYVVSATLPESNIRLKIETTSEKNVILNTFIPNTSMPAGKLSARVCRAVGIYNEFAYVLVYSASAPDYALYKYNLNQPNAAPIRIAVASSNFDAAYLDTSSGTIYMFGSNLTTLYVAKYDIGSNTLTYATLVCPSTYNTSFIDDLSAEGLLRISGNTSTTFHTANINKATLALSGSFAAVTTTAAAITTACDGVNTYYIWQDIAVTAGGVYISALASDNVTNIIGGTYRIAGYANISMKALYDSGSIYISTYSRETLQKTNYIAKVDLSGLNEDSRWQLIAKSGFINSTFNNSYNRLFKINNILHSVQTVLSESSTGSSLADPASYRNLQTVEHDLGIANTAPAYDQDTLIIPSSISKMYDGASLVEVGFLDSAEINGGITQGLGPGAPFYVNGGVYGIALIFSWIDNNGYKHRSAPWFKTETVAGASVGQLLFSVKNLGLTNKENVQIEVYRTVSNGTVYYKHDSAVYYNIENNSFTTIVLNSASFTDAVLTTKEILYTSGDVLENDPPATGTSSIAFKNRVFISNDKSVQYSKLITVGEPITFNASLTIKPKSNLGNIVGVAGMDNVLVIFAEEGIFIQSGDGPNNLGQQDDYGLPQQISSDVGCSDARSIVNTPDGIMFKSEKGIYLLNRGLYVSYIGAAVEDYNSQTIVGAQLLNNTNEVRFLTATNILSYDYLLKQWSVFTNVNSSAVDCIIHENNFHYLRNNGLVYKQDDNFFTNNSAFYAGKLETNWISVAGLNNNGGIARSPQGFQRLYSIYLLGKYKSAHNLSVSIAYNYDETIVDTATIVTAPGVYQYEVRPSIQKCESFKLIIMDASQAGTGESLVLSSILLEIGVKATPQKVTGDSSKFSAT